ncbi:MAG: TonB family protein [Acidobacteriota bacterium]
MAKIMKYCGSCEEGFAEKFAFCPDCGGALQAFEMNPLADGPKSAPAANSGDTGIVNAAAPPVPGFIASEPVAAAVSEPEALSTPAYEAEAAEPEITPDTVIVDEPAPAYEVAAPTIADTVYRTEPMNADVPRSEPAPHYVSDGYHITVIEEKNVKQRNVLLLGATAFMLVMAVTATIVSLFNKALGVDAIGNETSLAYLIDEVPMNVEEEKVVKEKDKGGGGGGGGREEKEETTLGDLADQSKNPTRPPDAKVFRSDNFELKTPPPQTEGNRTFEKKYNNWGDPNGRFTNLSNGPGTGGGQGTGNGTGQGSGNGTGTGSGNGSGSGSGNGSGNGEGEGPGGRNSPPPPPDKTAKTEPLKILFKPKGTYTDEARTNNVQGTVRLKITLLASGAIGSITPVTRLPHGLTEQAIAAARQIKFEPAKVNGVAVSKIVTFDYGFNIY